MPELELFAAKAPLGPTTTASPPRRMPVPRARGLGSVIARMTRLALVALACSPTAGCGAARSPCSSERCPTTTVCDLDGRCRPMPAPSRAATFSQSLGLYATHFGNPDNRRGGVPRSSDRLWLGGDAGAVIDLTFSMPARQRNVVEAVLVLFPYPHTHTASEAATIEVVRMQPVSANRTQQGVPPRPIRRPLSARVERPSARQALRLDVLDAARDVIDAPLALRVRMPRGGDNRPWRFASPHTLDVELRPRLELLLR